MSRVSTIFEAMLLRLQTILPAASGWSRLINAYVIEENPIHFLEQGYGIAFADGVNLQTVQSAKIAMQRNMRVLLSRKVFATELDVEAFDGVTKQLLEDARSVVGDFEQNVSLGGQQMNVQFISDSGVQFVSADTDSFIYLELSFTVRYIENLS